MTAPMSEEQAIATLKRIAKRWPPTLWLFAGGAGTISIMRCGPDGRRVSREVNGGTGYSPDACIDFVAIPSDGGDF